MQRVKKLGAGPQKILLAALTFVFTFAHLYYAWWVSMLLYQWSGGIRKDPNGWTEFGGASYAWTIPLQIRGTLLMRLGESIDGNQSQGPFQAIGALAVFAVSVFIAYAIGSLIVAALSEQHKICGRYYWRIIIILLGMLWVPVREDWAEVYQYTVVY